MPTPKSISLPAGILLDVVVNDDTEHFDAEQKRTVSTSVSVYMVDPSDPGEKLELAVFDNSDGTFDAFEAVGEIIGTIHSRVPYVSLNTDDGVFNDLMQRLESALGTKSPEAEGPVESMSNTIKSIIS